MTTFPETFNRVFNAKLQNIHGATGRAASLVFKRMSLLPNASLSLESIYQTGRLYHKYIQKCGRTQRAVFIIHIEIFSSDSISTIRPESCNHAFNEAGLVSLVSFAQRDWCGYTPAGVLEVESSWFWVLDGEIICATHSRIAPHFRLSTDVLPELLSPLFN